MAITDMTSLRRGNDTLRWAGFGADYEVIAAKVKLFKSDRLQEEKVTVKLERARDLLQERDVEFMTFKLRRELSRIGDQAIEVSLRKDLGKCFHHFLAASSANEPIVDDSHTETREIDRGLRAVHPMQPLASFDVSTVLILVIP
jgi:hypothetical protein